MRWDANSLSARMLHLLHQFVPDLYSVTLILPTSLRWLNTVFKCGCAYASFTITFKLFMVWDPFFA